VKENENQPKASCLKEKFSLKVSNKGEACMVQPDVAVLCADCRSGDPDKQLLALLELIKLHDESCLPDIIPLLASPDEQVRAEAVYAIGCLGSAQAPSLAPLLLPLLRDPHEQVRDEAVKALGLVIYPPASAALQGMVRNDPSWLVRASAAEALGNYHDATIIPELEQVLHNPQEKVEVKIYAARSLGRIADAAYRPVLDAMIAEKGREPLVRAALQAAGYRLGGHQYLDGLLDLLQHANEPESWSLLNEVQYLVEDNQQPTLAAGAPRIRAALQTIVLRWPLTAKHVQVIENQLLYQPQTSEPFQMMFRVFS
jgi:HEAT repeat protein